jgi:hypothetical protein
MNSNQVVLKEIAAIKIGVGEMLVVHSKDRLTPEQQEEIAVEFRKHRTGGQGLMFVNGDYKVGKLNPATTDEG